MWLFPNLRVLIRGAGDLASGIAYRLVRAGIPVIMTELPTPLFVRREVAYGNAIYMDNHEMVVEGITAKLVKDTKKIPSLLDAGVIPIFIDESATIRDHIYPTPQVIIDARLQKQKLDTTLQDAELVIGLGPGFTVGEDCHLIVETNRGHTLGRVIDHGSAIPNTGTPGFVAGHGKERVLRAQESGRVLPVDGVQIGSLLKQDQIIAQLGEQVITAPFEGVLRGLIHPSVHVWGGLKIGDVDPRGNVENCFTISDKALSIGGGALEAILGAEVIQGIVRATP